MSLPHIDHNRIAAHECGYAIQHKLAYAPLQWRLAAVGLTSFASQLVMWLPLAGMFAGLLSTRTGLLVMALGWGVIMVFSLITPQEHPSWNCRSPSSLS